MHASPRTIGYLSALLATALWSGNFLTSRVIAHELTPFVTTFLRWAAAICFLLPFAWKEFSKEWHIIRKHIPYYLATSFTGVVGMQVLIYQAGHTTTALNMSLIASSMPIWVALFARIFLKEHISMRQVIGIAVAMFGTAMLITHGDINVLMHMQFALGDAWMILAALFFAYYSILLRNKVQGVSPFATLLITFILGFAMLLPFAVWDFCHGATVPMTPQVIASIVYIGLCASLIAFIFWTKAVENIGPIQSSLVYCSLPFFSALGGYLLLGEDIRMSQLLSGLFILGGTIIAMKRQ